MRLTDSFIGKDAKTLTPYINNSKIVKIIEISSHIEIPTKLDELKKAILKQTKNYIIAVFQIS